ncbi:ADP-ribosylation [Tothia fuscella]|uniref:ADP-ribosylation n=1 Tax=Tothia fuscella TaxID=1048955 RepID=A0A9P4TVG4_9PEZI|nr:ADP-ribosylation [Tothia fuscella]
MADEGSQGGQLCHTCQKLRYRDDSLEQRETIDTLFQKLAPAEVYQSRGTEEAADFQGSSSLYELCSLILRLVEEATSYIVEYRNNLNEADFLQYPIWATRTRSLSKEDDHETKEEGSFTIWETPNQVLDVSVRELCERIVPKDGDLSVIHCENVMRWDFYAAFREEQESMRQELGRHSLSHLRNYTQHERAHGTKMKQKEEIIEELVNQQITFHGTKKANVASIVRNGFIKPGELIPTSGIPLGVRCGNSFGRGIYSSPDSAFATIYSEFDAHPTTEREIAGLKLIVCATIMGRRGQVYRGGGQDWRKFNTARPGTDSHVGNNNLEYIVFDSAQILPCYVIHLDWHARPSRTLLQLKSRAARLRINSEIPVDKIFPGDKQRYKAERLAQARKFFAYGFGPVSRNKIVIEDMADLDGDEEDYGEYQAERVDTYYGAKSIWDWRPEAGLGNKAAD